MWVLYRDLNSVWHRSMYVSFDDCVVTSVCLVKDVASISISIHGARISIFMINCLLKHNTFK